MTIQSASIITKTGKPLLSRSFFPPTTPTYDLLALFPRLISNSEHTYVEHGDIRYVYQPIENLYMVLITKRGSNIIQDIDTLHLFARVVSDIVKTVDEGEVVKSAYELLFAFDEIVHLGYQEWITLSGVQYVLEMDSYDERMAEMVNQNKENEAKERAKLKAKQMDAERKEQQRRTTFNAPSSSSSSRMDYSSQQSYTKIPPTSQAPIASSSAGNTYSPVVTAAPVKGMQLGKKTKTSDFMNAIKAEVGMESSPLLQEQTTMAEEPQHIQQQPAAPTESIHIIIEEKIVLIALKDGGLQSMEVKGDMNVCASDPERCKFKVQLEVGNNKDVQFKNHPNTNKNDWTNGNIIGLKDPSKPYPLNQPVAVLKWRYVSTDENQIPLQINCWPTPTQDGFDVNIEYELIKSDLELEDVVVRIPHPANISPPVINEIVGEYTVGPSHFLWRIPRIDRDNASGTIEYSIKAGSWSTEQFFPLQVVWEKASVFAGIKIVDVKDISNQTLPFSSSSTLLPESYMYIAG